MLDKNLRFLGKKWQYFVEQANPSIFNPVARPFRQKIDFQVQHFGDEKALGLEESGEEISLEKEE